MPRPKVKTERKLRRIVHVLLDDLDYIRLLQISSPQSMSEWGRDAIKQRLDEEESRLQLTPEEFYQNEPDRAT